jgi:hypothetical protein
MRIADFAPLPAIAFLAAGASIGHRRAPESGRRYESTLIEGKAVPW